MVQRGAVADIAREYAALEGTAQETAVVIKGTKVDIHLTQRTIFTCNGEEVLL